MHNMIIAGIGGQGINRLTQVISMACHAHGKACQYTVHKGGAQSLGSVYGELRITDEKRPVLGPDIPVGKLDSLVALEAWEGLRHCPKAGQHTRAWIETASMPLFVERQSQVANYVEQTDPLDLYKDIPVHLIRFSYRQQALTQCGDVHMANYFAGLDCLKALGIEDVSIYQEHFFNVISAARQHKGKLLS